MILETDRWTLAIPDIVEAGDVLGKAVDRLSMNGQVFEKDLFRFIDAAQLGNHAPVFDQEEQFGRLPPLLLHSLRQRRKVLRVLIASKFKLTLISRLAPVRI